MTAPDKPAREALIERIEQTLVERETVSIDGYGAKKALDLLKGRDSLLREAITALRTPAEETEAVAERIKEVCREEGLNGAACGWRSCTGCHESNEGVPQGAYSPTFKTHVGFGCGECGGLGVVWEYWSKDSLDDMARDLTTPPVDEAKVRVTDAAADVLAERRRQVEDEGWTPAHDDAHDQGQMAGAALCYLAEDIPHWARQQAHGCYWPWDATWWKPTDHRRNLVKAGALILAEIERLDRLSPAPAVDEKQGEGRT